MPNIMNLGLFRTKSPREFRIATPKEFVTTWLGWVAILSLLYFAALALGVLPGVLRVQAPQAGVLRAR